MLAPFLRRLQAAGTILLAGAGGGYDVFSALPLYAWLRSLGKTVHLANLSFTNLSRCQGDFPVDSLLRVNAQTPGPAHYFPEKHLAAFLGQPVYAVENAGPAAAARAYTWLVQELQPDALVLIDGGTDILMRGDEHGLGTPEEDFSSLLAAHDVDVPCKLLACLGFGIDSFHGVCHVHVLENVAALIRAGGFLGSWSVQPDSPEFMLFRDACRYAFLHTPARPSIVNGSILSAIEGDFGDVHSTTRTRGSELFINPLMTLYWGFELDRVAERNLFLPHLRGLRSREELALRLEELHLSIPRHRAPRPIPD